LKIKNGTISAIGTIINRAIRIIMLKVPIFLLDSVLSVVVSLLSSVILIVVFEVFGIVASLEGLVRFLRVISEGIAVKAEVEVT